MSTVQTNETQTSTETNSLTSTILAKIRSWLSVWEMYPILFIAAFLRFYQISTTEFDEDQAMVFRMAHDAIVHGLIPATANIASIRIVNPPAVIYLFMIPAAFSANPLWGNVYVGLFNLIAVLLTYIFVRRYYGRLAAVISSLLYATAFTPIFYSRFLWQLNLDTPFVVPFIFALFWGVVDRRKGWLFPALLLLGILFQLQETTIILIVPLLVAILLAPGTVRWRDLILGVASLSLIFFTYLIWEFYTKFADLNTIIQFTKLHARADTMALNYYRLFLDPFNHVPTNSHALLFALAPYIGWLHRFMLPLILCGFATAILGVILRSLPNSRTGRSGANEWWRRLRRPALHHPSISLDSGSGTDVEGGRLHHPIQAGFNALRATWTELRANPQRCGYLMLLTWQLVPVIILTRHAVPLFPYYLLMVLPGPFILIGLFLSTLVYSLPRHGRGWNIPRYGVYAITGLVIVGLLLGSFATFTDEANGNNTHGYSYNTLNSLQDALAETDRLALHQHFNHAYIATDAYTQTALSYLAEQMQTPTTLFDASRCLVLPGPASGPAALLVGPGDKLTGALLAQFALATLVDQPERLGGAPFRLYIVQPMGEPQPNATNEAFVNNLQLLDNRARQFSFDNSTWLASRWSFMRSAEPNYRTTYTYTMTALLHGNANNTSTISSQCDSTSIRAGDQLIVTFKQPEVASVPASVTISTLSYTTMPFNLMYGPFRLENIRDQRTQPSFLQTSAGTSGITLSV